MKKLLVLTGRYYPKASPNSICVKQVIDALPGDWQTTVIAYDDGLKEEGEERVFRVGRGAVLSGVYRNEEAKTPAERRKLKLLRTLDKLKQLPFVFSWPWVDPVVTKRTLRLAERLYEKERFDAVIAVHMPISNVIVGHRLKKKHPGMRFYPYFLDALTGGYLPKGMSRKTYERKALKWEKKLLSNADKAVFMDANRAHHELVFEGDPLKERFVYLDIPLLKERERGVRNKTGGVDIVYVGSLAGEMRSPEFFLKVFEKAAAPDWRLTFVGDAGSAPVNSFAARDERIKVVGRLPHEEALSYVRGADLLLNLGNRNPNLTPSKVFEYMGFGKRIVSTYSSDEDKSVKALEKYPAALLLDERGDADAAAEALRGFVSRPAEEIPFSELEKLFYMNTPEAFKDIITGDGI